MARLWLARSLAWALLIGGWLVLGALGRELTPRWAGGQAIVALWLVTMAVALRAGAHRELGPAALRGVLVVTGAGTAWMLMRVAQGHGAGALAGVAVGWGLLLVAVSRSVRSLRHALPRRPGPPFLPAMAGAAAAGWAAGALPSLPGDLAAVAGGLMVAAGVCAAALPLHAPALVGCRGGLFDCAWPWPTWARWRAPAEWPFQAASLAMLPMMSSLPAMGDWCGGAFGNAHAVLALHLAAMLVPALLCRRLSRPASRWLVTGLLGAGLIALALRPGLAGLMSASLLHAAAWSVAWAAPMPAGRGAPAVPSMRPVDGVIATLAGPAIALLLGSAIAQWGPEALAAAHAMLGVVGVAGLCWMGHCRIRGVADRPWQETEVRWS